MLIAYLYLKISGFNKLFYKPQRNAIAFISDQLTPIQTMTSDGVQLGGFLIHPTNRNALSNVTLVYLHGISFDPKQKVPEMMEYAN